MSEDELTDTLLEVVTADQFDEARANDLLKKLKKLKGPHPFEEAEPIGDMEADFLGHIVTRGTLPALKWAIKKKVMNPPDLDLGAYSVVSIMDPDENADSEIAPYMLKKYGLSFVEVPAGDIPEEGRQLVRDVLGEELVDDEDDD